MDSTISQHQRLWIGGEKTTTKKTYLEENSSPHSGSVKLLSRSDCKMTSSLGPSLVWGCLRVVEVRIGVGSPLGILLLSDQESFLDLATEPEKHKSELDPPVSLFVNLFKQILYCIFNFLLHIYIFI